MHADAAWWKQLALLDTKAQTRQRVLDCLLDRFKEGMHRRKILYHQQMAACEAQRRWQAARLLQNLYRKRKCAKWVVDVKLVRQQALELTRREKEEKERRNKIFKELLHTKMEPEK